MDVILDISPDVEIVSRSQAPITIRSVHQPSEHFLGKSATNGFCGNEANMSYAS
jgi:hypothetical protein